MSFCRFCAVFTEKQLDICTSGPLSGWHYKNNMGTEPCRRHVCPHTLLYIDGQDQWASPPSLFFILST